MPGFEPGTTCTPSRCATRLRYIPKGSVALSTTLLQEGQHSTQLVAHLEQHLAHRLHLLDDVAVAVLDRRDLGLRQARHRLRCVAASAELHLETLLRARDREALFVEELLDAQHGLDVLAPVDALARAVLRRRERRELRLPVPKHVRLGVGDLADLADLEEQLVGYLLFHRWSLKPLLVHHGVHGRNEELRRTED